METTVDNNPTAPSAAPDTKEALAARIQAAEANPQSAKAHQTANGTVTSDAQAQPVPTPPAVTPQPPANKDSLQQFKDKEGNVDDSKIEKANEHLKQGIKEKREALLQENKKLLSEFTKTSQEVKKVRELGAQAPIPEGGQPVDENRRFLELMAKADNDPTILRQLIREEAEAIINPLRSEWEQGKQDRAANQLTDELVELAESGATWIVTEGTGRFQDVFKSRPWLMQSQTPYKDAMKFMDVPKGPAPAPAQGGTIPILGSGSAVPPPSSAPTATTEQKMSDLSAKFREALKWNDRSEANRLMAEMTRLESGR